MVDDPDNENIRIIEHTADWALRLRGRDLKELFAHAAEGMAYLLAGDVASLHLEHARDVVLESHDAAELLELRRGPAPPAG